MKQDNFYKLKIVAGLHKDAELFLEPEVTYTVGSGDECDIILLDTGVEQKHLKFSIFRGKIQIECEGAELLLDGKPAPYTSFELSDFQVVSIGDAHFAIGPGNKIWPALSPPLFETIDIEPICTDLVIFDSERYLPQTIQQPGFFESAWYTFTGWFSLTDKKVLACVSVFFLALGIFVLDAWFTSAPLATVVQNTMPMEINTPTTMKVESTPPVQKKGILLAAVDGLINIQKNTLVSAGIAEPHIPMEAPTAKPADDPVEQIRTVLKKTWGNNLTEIQESGESIHFKGYDDQSEQNLALSLEKNAQGELCARGITGTPKTKKAILSQMGDMIRIKVDVSEEMENVCKRVLRKKGVRQPKVQYDIEGNALTLEGRSKDRKTISAVRDIVAKAFPEIEIKNRIKSGDPTGKINISGVAIGGAPHVILKDGSKIFTGGKLDNGCTVVRINNDHVMLNCNGDRIKHRL